MALLQLVDVKYLVRHYNTNKEPKTGWSNVAEALRKSYNKDYDYPTNERMSPIRIKQIGQDEIYRVINEEIVPLIG